MGGFKSNRNGNYSFVSLLDPLNLFVQVRAYVVVSPSGNKITGIIYSGCLDVFKCPQVACHCLLSIYSIENLLNKNTCKL